mmetsp:Transcript_9689/g.34424  ORF Transcript_9689/g.34424 Transcript_9689/m.34424 type:complete len:311 (+) Transcript_9689:47-979(+)|eukprot:CAMPEP_0203904950 /NCGR_PEP_ID=MMETSP0359-20131031/46706_1 /ASSEMBLY_ACC=CAM_ASM_000338 /TAXON_ID=268821 /ORGANISM="Scrippsiella Hangoei, Strain SHTV-5" /LENGTH=310 /DNA_ID=CAMNT_0050829297 /DNA_START=18 /DNA_END=950 /DNA_ORIENTATION=+
MDDPLRFTLVDAPPFHEPCPAAVASLVRDWIRGARQEGEAPGAEGQQQPASEGENARLLFGALDLISKTSSTETLLVFVHRKRLFVNRERFILLHFYASDSAPQSKLKDQKEVGFVYFTASSGMLHGFHVGAEHRGRGLMKLQFLYYVLFCRQFDLLALDTARNKKPLFAKLYHQMGYEPCCFDFPFLLFEVRSHIAEGRSPSITCYVLPLSAEDPVWASDPKRETKWEGDTSWNISRKTALSQGFVVLDGSSDLGARIREQGGGLNLFAKTTWRLPDANAVSRRDSMLEALSLRARCVMYSSPGASEPG